jgi:hypothetical protein
MLDRLKEGKGIWDVRGPIWFFTLQSQLYFSQLLSFSFDSIWIEGAFVGKTLSSFPNVSHGGALGIFNQLTNMTQILTYWILIMVKQVSPSRVFDAKMNDLAPFFRQLLMRIGRMF